MLSASLNDIAAMLGVAPPSSDVLCNGVSTDTRSLAAGNLFVALNGPKFRGADFVQAARERGAVAALVDTLQQVDMPQLLVRDTRQALQHLARAWRAMMTPLLIGITGSNGKTTMRSMIAACCPDNTLATQGNLNNDIGVPLTLLRLSEQHRFAVIEMGANAVGDIKLLADIAKPAIGIVTNAGPAHLEGFGSLQGVADGKGELFSALGADDTAIINRDDTYYAQWREMAAPATVMTFGSTPAADVWFDDLRIAEHIEFALHVGDDVQQVALRLGGEHNAYNACGALAVALAAGLPLDESVARLSAVEAEPGRQRSRIGRHGGAVIDDSYNANPASMRASAAAAVAAHDDVYMVIGDMGELGDDAIQMHADLGAQLRDIGVSQLFAFGPLAAHAAAAFGPQAMATQSLDELIAALQTSLNAGTAVIVKGSRSMRMERIVDLLCATKQECH
ncbi:MAG: UDP-N-acetylmuramoyl-tripeptide--D-alanyl-D-alanine ligase [Pseudomonadota bacterium]